MNNTKRMYATNKKVKDWLIKNGYNDIALFPHTRFIKDVHFQGQDFDGIASKGMTLILFQIKTNVKATKNIIEQYKNISHKFGIQCLWINYDTKKRMVEVNNGLPI